MRLDGTWSALPTNPHSLADLRLLADLLTGASVLGGLLLLALALVSLLRRVRMRKPAAELPASS